MFSNQNDKESGKLKTLIPTWSEWIKFSIALITLLTFLAGVFTGPLNFFAKWYAKTHLGLTEELSGGPCLTIPQTGHHINPQVSVGEWTEVTWRNVIRHRGEDCGAPIITGWIKNGDNILHAVTFSIMGVALEQGIRDISYLFKVGDGPFCGSAALQILVRFPEARPPSGPELSPWVPFQLTENCRED